MHGFEHRRMLAHAEIIVGTPDGHAILQAMIEGLRKVTSAPLEVGKDPISAFPSYEIETRLKELIEIHRALRRLSMSVKSSGPNRVKPFSDQRSLPFNVSRQSVAFVRTRPAPPVIYSASVLASLRGSRGIIRRAGAC